MKRHLLAVFTVVFLAQPALATPDGWPALYSVTGVAAEDVLNLRAGPSADSDIIGTLAPDATDIEVVAPNETATWGLVNLAERSGWVHLRFMRRQAEQRIGEVPEIAACYGTEPFWSLDLTDGATFSTPERSAKGQVLMRHTSPNRRDRHGLTIWLDGELLQAVVAQQRCSDGMSDREMGLEINAFYGQGMLSGCCTLMPWPHAVSD